MRRLLMVLALICGVSSGALVYAFMLDVQKKSQLPPPPPVPVVVPRQDIEAGTRLTMEMLAIKQVPAEAKHPGAASSPGDVVAKLTLYPLVAGEQLLTSRLIDQPKLTGLSGVIPPGRRAVAVAINDVVGAGGLIQPGDRVDVLAVFESRDGTRQNTVAVISLENIEVLAVSQDVAGLTHKEGTAVQAVADSRKAATTPSSPQTARTVTLSVTPEEAQRLLLADRAGTLRLALRPKGDLGRASATETDLRSVATVQ